MTEDEELIEQYTRQVSRKSLDPKPYDRLMIYYRQRQKFREELQVLEKGIALFSRRLEVRHHSLAVKRISKLIGKATGLMDKSGNHLYIPGPLQKWMKRRKIVLAKLKRKAKTTSRH